MRTFLFSRALAAAFLAVVGIAAADSAFAAAGTITVTASTVLAEQSGGKISVVVHRNGGSTGAATATYLTRNGSAEAGVDFTGQTGTLQWNAGDASSKTITVALNSTPFGGTRTFAITLSKATGATLGLPNSTVVTEKGSKVASSGSGGRSEVTQLPGRPLKLAAKLGKPAQFLVGLGGQGTVNRPSLSIESQAAKIDIFETLPWHGRLDQLEQSRRAITPASSANNAESVGASSDVYPVSDGERRRRQHRRRQQ